MTLNISECNYLTPLRFKGLNFDSVNKYPNRLSFINNNNALLLPW